MEPSALLGKASTIEEAGIRHVQSGLLGFVVLNDQHVITESLGDLVSWITPGRTLADGVPFLAGYEEVFSSAPRDDKPCLILSRVRWIDPARGELPVFSVYAYSRAHMPGIILVIHDVSDAAEIDQKILQERNETLLTQGILRETQRQADAANRAKSAFLANISHELRTPLNVIIGNAEILGGQTSQLMPAEVLQEYTQDIHDSGIILLELVNDLLDVAKAEAGHLELIEEMVPVRDLLDDAFHLAQKLPAARGVDFELADIDPGLMLLCDPRRVKQIALNLLSNAVKFTTVGQKIGLRAWSQNNGALAIEVSDTGVGIPADEIADLTKPFIQATGSSNGGTGLGLHLVKTFAELHDGNVDISSEVGKGTTVTVHFPPWRTTASGRR